jgi:hypothetical protein
MFRVRPLALFLIVAVPLRAQRAPELSDVGRARFTSIASVRELSDGAVLLSDPRSRAVWAVSRSGDRQPVELAGLQAPGRLTPFGADSTLVLDRGASAFRLLVGLLEAPLPPALSLPSSQQMIAPRVDRWAADAAKGVWTLDRGRDGRARVLRRRDASGAMDSVAALADAPTVQSGSGGIRITRSVPYSAVDDWALDPQGDLIVVRAQPLRVDRRTATGTWTHGDTLPAWPLPLTAADRAYSNAQVAKEGASMNIGGGSVALPELPDGAWPASLPPFAVGTIAVAPDGAVWIGREHGARTDRREFLIVTRDGRLRERILLPAHSRIVGFGATDAYVALPWGDEERLQRFPWR